MRGQGFGVGPRGLFGFLKGPWGGPLCFCFVSWFPPFWSAHQPFQTRRGWPPFGFGEGAGLLGSWMFSWPDSGPLVAQQFSVIFPMLPFRPSIRGLPAAIAIIQFKKERYFILWCLSRGSQTLGRSPDSGSPGPPTYLFPACHKSRENPWAGGGGGRSPKSFPEKKKPWRGKGRVGPRYTCPPACTSPIQRFRGFSPTEPTVQ